MSRRLIVLFLPVIPWPCARTGVSTASHTMHAGLLVGVSGANGSGKTSLLRCVCADLTPTMGAARERAGSPRRRPEGLSGSCLLSLGCCCLLW